MMDSIDDATMARSLKFAVVLLFLFAIVMVMAGRLMIAGVSFLGITFAIYYRETLT